MLKIISKEMIYFLTKTFTITLLYVLISDTKQFAVSKMFIIKCQIVCILYETYEPKY